MKIVNGAAQGAFSECPVHDVSDRAWAVTSSGTQALAVHVIAIQIVEIYACVLGAVILFLRI
jgi:hypothetical protein